MSMKTGVSCYEQWLSEGLDVWAYCFVFLQFKRYHSSVNSGERLGIAILKKKHSNCLVVQGPPWMG